jgi:hypothetical protein
VSCAIINSSFVGITYTGIFESLAEISLNSPLKSFFASSILTPSEAIFSQISLRVVLLFSPTHAVITITSAQSSMLLYIAM